MDQQPPNHSASSRTHRSAPANGPASGKQAGAMRPARSCTRELAERWSSGTHVRLLRRPRTRQAWVEVPEPDDRVLILVQWEQALDAFITPYAYAAHRLLVSAQSLAPYEPRPQAVHEEHRGQ
jgi:hypothetical protein